jgi:P-type Cu2+ transporter
MLSTNGAADSGSATTGSPPGTTSVAIKPGHQTEPIPEQPPTHAMPVGHEMAGKTSGHNEHAGHNVHSGHDKHAGHDPAAFRRRFWLSLVLTVPVVVSSKMVMDWFGYSLKGVAWVGPALGTFVFVWGGQPFLVGAWREFKSRSPGMMLLIAMAITVAWSASMASSLGWFDLDFWWELAALVTIMLLGHWLEMSAIGQAKGALDALAKLLPDEAERIGADGRTATVAASELVVGDLVLVRPGGRLPADGTIVDGSAELDESMITGESRPVPRTVGAPVIAGTVSTDAALRIRVAAIGDDTALAGIGRLVSAAQESKSKAQALADRFAGLLFYVSLAAAAITFTAWALAGRMDRAVTNTVTVLVIACPHALGLAIPLVVAISTSMSAKAGILVKDRMALERMRTITAVLFDKTGTLTKGEHVVTDHRSMTDGGDDELLRIAAAIEADSEHPLARAIVRAGTEVGNVAVATNFSSSTGRGVEATIDGHHYAIGGPALLRERKVNIPIVLATDVDAWSARGAAVLTVLEGTNVIGALALEDGVRPEAAETISELNKLNIRTIMITGDAKPVAAAVGAQLGITEVFAEVLPEDKSKTVAELQQRGLAVAMVGDGVNDAPALAKADVGLAIGSGADVAIESAGVILARNDPRAVLSVIRLSKATYRKMLQNLGWAAGYNIITLPLAAGAFSWAGIDIPPALGAVLMSLSTIVVALNAQLLRRTVL